MRTIGDTRDVVDVVMDRATFAESPRSGRQYGQKASGSLVKFEKLKRNLRRLLAQEDASPQENGHLGDVADRIKEIRQRVERELVQAATFMAEQAGTMGSREAAEWRKCFTRKEQDLREAAGHRIDVIAQLARFL